MNKTFSKIRIIIVFIALITGGILAWQYFGLKAETTNWNTYRNVKYGYEIKYPPNLKMEKEELEKRGIPVEIVSRISWSFPQEIPEVTKEIVIDIRDNPEKKPLLSFLEYESASCKIEAQEPTFARISCKEKIEGTNQGLKLIDSAFGKDRVVYKISLVILGLISDLDFPHEVNVYNLMFSTFKFIEKEKEIKAPTPESNSRDNRRLSDMKMIESCLEIIHDEKGYYPGITGSNQWDTLKGFCNLEQNLFLPSGPYEYWVSSDNQSYILKTTLENYHQLLKEDIDGTPFGKAAVQCGIQGENEREYCIGRGTK
ncbi:MAG: hypothetical protein QME61_04300 [Patescibacteria group bacterium]|nr:hypothetical protein [Patescibacteria group bacterium]